MRVSTMTVYRLIRDGELPVIRVGKHFRLRAVDVDRFLSAAPVNPTDPRGTRTPTTRTTRTPTTCATHPTHRMATRPRSTVARRRSDSTSAPTP